VEGTIAMLHGLLAEEYAKAAAIKSQLGMQSFTPGMQSFSPRMPMPTTTINIPTITR